MDSPPLQGWEPPCEPQQSDVQTAWDKKLEKLESELNTIKTRLEELCTGDK